MPSRLIPAATRDEGIASFARFASHFLPGRDLVLSVEEAREERTPKQRAALFGVAYASLMAQMGLHGAREKDDLHEFMLGEFFGWRERPGLGWSRKFPVRTTTTDEHGRRDVLSTRQQIAFYKFIQQRAAEFGYDIPDPDKEWYRRAEREEELERQAQRAE